MKVLVTGGAGFIGSHIVDLLIETGYNVIVVDNLSTGNLANVHKKAVFYFTDLGLDPTRLEEIFQKENPDYVIHQAAQVDVTKSLKDPAADAAVNIIGTLHLLECCRKFQIKKVVYASSCAVYGETEDCSIDEDFQPAPLSFYGISKLTPEWYFKRYGQFYGIPFTILRYANVYGPRQTVKGEGGVISIFMKKAIAGEQIVIYGDGEQTRDFVYVKDVAAANLLALKKGTKEIINIGRNQKTTINQLYALISAMFDDLDAPVHGQERPGDIRFSRLNNEKAARLLEWKPQYELPRGLEETFIFYQHLFSAGETG
jgi:UDP-glucose 4-epimerase